MVTSNMSAAAQRARVITLLSTGPQTTYNFRAHGISHPAQRIKELLIEGHAIHSSRVTAVDSDGYSHNRVAMYSLESQNHHQDPSGEEVA